MSKKQKSMTAQRAAEIINDIHEGLCRASREELMECANFYAMRSTYLWQEIDSAYTNAMTHALVQLTEFQKRWKERDNE